MLSDDFLPCVKRQKMLLMNQKGQQRAVWKCGEQKCDEFTKEVTPDVCAACPLREEVMKIAIQSKEYTPPGFAQIHRIRWRKPDHDPAFVPCIDRQRVGFETCCNKIDETQVCNSPAAKHLGAEVTPNICQNCPVRRG